MCAGHFERGVSVVMISSVAVNCVEDIHSEEVLSNHSEGMK